MIEYVDEYPGQTNRGGRPRKPEFDAVRALESGQTIRFPCRWSHHSGTGQCNGTASAYGTAKRHGFRVHSTCKDGYVYVNRP